MKQEIHSLILSRICSLLFIVTFNCHILAQDSLHNLRISMVTVAPGTELYSIYGHSAIRIIDSTDQSDLSYNFGTFDFDTPNFYPKFLKGKLPYIMSVAPFHNFLQEYQYERRAVSEQVLTTSQEEKNKIQQVLNENARPENREYKYDFFYDNCATRIRDVFVNNTSSTVTFGEGESRTFRSLIHEYLSKTPWAKFGVDLIIGSPADKSATLQQQMFLPDYLQKYFAESLIDSAKYLFEPSKEILYFDGADASQSLTTSNMKPIFVFSILGILIMALGFFIKRPIAFILANTVFAIFGFAGILIAFMWFGTDHLATKVNYNLLWMSPLYLLIPFMNWKYSKYLLALLGLMTILSITPLLPQMMPVVTLLPLIVGCYVAYVNNYPDDNQISEV